MDRHLAAGLHDMFVADRTNLNEKNGEVFFINVHIIYIEGHRGLFNVHARCKIVS